MDENKIKILVAEDNASNYKLVEAILHSDYELIHAQNGLEAVSLFETHLPTVVLMDINMPIMDGYQAFERIRAISPATPVVALTAYAFEADIKRVLDAGFDHCLTKPLRISELSRVVKSMADRNQMSTN